MRKSLRSDIFKQFKTHSRPSFSQVKSNKT